MEHSCYKCNAPVAAGTPFCPQCSAPQIRVMTSVEAQQHDPADALSGDALSRTIAGEKPAATHIRWSSAFPRAAAAALATVALLQLLTVVTGQPALGFAALPVGGAFAVYLYARRQPQIVNAGMGARLGAVTGLLVFVIYFCISVFEVMADKQQVYAAMQKAMQDAAARNPNPQTDAVIRQISTPEGMTALLVLAAFLMFFIILLLCTAGGTMGAGLFGRRAGRES